MHNALMALCVLFLAQCRFARRNAAVNYGLAPLKHRHCPQSLRQTDCAQRISARGLPDKRRILKCRYYIQYSTYDCVEYNYKFYFW